MLDRFHACAHFHMQAFLQAFMRTAYKTVSVLKFAFRQVVCACRHCHRKQLCSGGACREAYTLHTHACRFNSRTRTHVHARRLSCTLSCTLSCMLSCMLSCTVSGFRACFHVCFKPGYLCRCTGGIIARFQVKACRRSMQKYARGASIHHCETSCDEDALSDAETEFCAVE